MAEVLISFRRPDSLTESEMQAWVIERGHVARRPLVLSQSLLRVELDPELAPDAEEELADLMLDMRLLGLRPAVIEPKMGTNTDTPG